MKSADYIGIYESFVVLLVNDQGSKANPDGFIEWQSSTTIIIESGIKGRHEHTRLV